MASVSPLLSVSPYFRIKNQPSIPPNKRRSVNHVPCRASNGDQTTPMNGKSASKFDRRDVLFGLGGLYGVAALSSHSPALAQPLAPDVDRCKMATINGDEKLQCCPPKMHNIIDFVHPYTKVLRVRPAAHLIAPQQLHKFEKAIDLMKRLPRDDPRNFYSQADVHCAYCNYGYKQLGFPDAEFQVHWNALFFPFHRAYLYFFERILGHLIDDPHFAIPFWNWDNASGMQMPQIYDNPDSPLYDTLRNPRHRPPKVLDLNYGKDENHSHDVVDSNLRWMNKQMMQNGNNAESFLGQLLVGCENADENHGKGIIESSPHDNIHNWVGDPNVEGHKNMGVFYAAARDPLFYGHHANVDRMWSIWQGLKNGERRDFNHPDWLNSSFVFYNEHKQPVRIRVRDCLNSEKLGYIYQNVPIPWRYKKQVPRRKTQLKSPPTLEAPPVVTFPQVLNSKITTAVKRPKKSSNETEKSKEDEVLVIQGIELDRNERVHFNVLANVVDDGSDVNPGNIEFVGTFTNVPHGHMHRGKTSLRLVITDVIEELGLQNDETLFVRLDPMVGGDKVTVGGIKIERHPKD